MKTLTTLIMKRHRSLALWSCLFIMMASAFSALGQGPVRNDILVSPNWLEAHLYHPGIVIVHVEETTDPWDNYASEHIPGARFVATESLGVNRAGVDGMLPPLDDLIELARELGIDDKTKKIVMYGPTNPGGPARLFQALDYLGLSGRIALLDGHFPRWKAQGRPTTDVVPPATYSDFVAMPDPQALMARLTLGDLMSTIALRRLGDPDLDGQGFILFDSRLDLPYQAGHIPGAVQANPLLDFEGFGPDGDGGVNPMTRWLLNARHEIVGRYHNMGLIGDKLAITSCRTGIAGSLLYFVLKYAGFDVTLYDGSFNEWSTVMIEDDWELGVWGSAYPGYAGNAVGMLPIATGPGRWGPVLE